MDTPESNNEPTLTDMLARLVGIEATLERLEALAKLAVRQKLSDKADKLAEEVQKRGRMTSGDVDKFFGTSRGWALNRMEKVGSQPGFKFVKGDSATKRPSVLVYDRSLVVQDQHRVIDELLSRKSLTPFYEVMNALGLDFPQVKLIVNEYAKARPNSRIVDGNKLEKIS